MIPQVLQSPAGFFQITGILNRVWAGIWEFSTHQLFRLPKMSAESYAKKS